MSENQAGREMDAEIAERVMGWDRGAIVGSGAPFWSRGDGLPLLTLGTESGAALFPLPGFSTDIAAAWLVVEKLRERFQRIEVHAVHLHEDAPCYVCMVEAESGTTQEHYVASAEAATAPLAICRAALALEAP